MENNAIEMQAKVYVYNLKNCASEYGFSAQEGWNLVSVSEYEKANLEKKYYPTLSVKVAPEQIAEMLRLVRDKLSSPAMDEHDTDRPARFDHGMQHVVAFNPKRLR
jgi:hypothetical protein